MEIFLIAFLVFLVFGLPFYIFHSVKSYFAERAREKNIEGLNQAYAIKPLLRYENWIDGLRYPSKIRRGGIDVSSGFNMPITSEVKRVIGKVLL